MSDIYKEYKKLEHEKYKLEQRVYHLENEIYRWLLSSTDMKEAFDRVDKKMNEQFGEEE